jgi:hypothetical protein
VDSQRRFAHPAQLPPDDAVTLAARMLDLAPGLEFAAPARGAMDLAVRRARGETVSPEALHAAQAACQQAWLGRQAPEAWSAAAWAAYAATLAATWATTGAAWAGRAAAVCAAIAASQRAAELPDAEGASAARTRVWSTFLVEGQALLSRRAAADGAARSDRGG